MQDARQFYINGSWVQPLDGTELTVMNPSNEEPFATISLGGQADTDAAVAAAKAAFPAWKNTPKADRIAALERLYAAYKERSDDMARAISQEMGAPIALARSAQVGAGMAHFKDAIKTLGEFEFEHQTDPNTPGSRILMEPVGVCALITPWNWP
ncbi:MAG: aldehyde dehydrogenase family protein, partial [Pseudomonadota bacterium]